LILRNVTLDDLDLYIAMRTDPVVMAELGGPLPIETVPDKVRRDAEAAASGESWNLAIVPEESNGEAVGIVVMWNHEDNGEIISEIGWMLRRDAMGRGIGTRAVTMALERAAADPRWQVLHAHAGVNNAASNAICRKLGFELVGLHEGYFADRLLTSNHWRLDLATWLNPSADPLAHPEGRG
jgi:RimJ/RimL family protein N-acetyltransferase